MEKALEKYLKKYGEFDVNAYTNLLTLGPYVFLCSKAIYEGQWKNGSRNGVGKQYWEDGCIYKGEWKDDKTNGRGHLIGVDGDIYTGDWVDDRAHGKGKYIHADGSTYEGDWI